MLDRTILLRDMRQYTRRMQEPIDWDCLAKVVEDFNNREKWLGTALKVSDAAREKTKTPEGKARAESDIKELLVMIAKDVCEELKSGKELLFDGWSIFSGPKGWTTAGYGEQDRMMGSGELKTVVITETDPDYEPLHNLHMVWQDDASYDVPMSMERQQQKKYGWGPVFTPEKELEIEKELKNRFGIG